MRKTFKEVAKVVCPNRDVILFSFIYKLNIIFPL